MAEEKKHVLLVGCIRSQRDRNNGTAGGTTEAGSGFATPIHRGEANPMMFFVMR